MQKDDEVHVKVSETKTLPGKVTSVHRGTVVVLLRNATVQTLDNNQYVKIVKRAGKAFYGAFRKKKTYHTK